MMKKALLFLFFISLSYALQCVDLGELSDFMIAEAGVYLAPLIMLLIVVIALLYAGGTVLNRPDLIIIAKDELYHLFISVIILISFGGVAVFSCLALDFFYQNLFSTLFESRDSYCYTLSSSVYDTAFCYADMLERDALKLAEEYTRLYISKLRESAFAVTMGLLITDTYTVASSAYNRVIANQYNFLLNTFIIPILTSIRVQKLALGFIQNELIKYALPAAIIARFIPFLRQSGNMGLVMVLSIYVIVPFFYVLGLSTFEYILTPQECAENALLQQALYDPPFDNSEIANSCNPDQLSFLAIARLLPQAVFLPNLTLTVSILFILGVNRALRGIG